MKNASCAPIRLAGSTSATPPHTPQIDPAPIVKSEPGTSMTVATM